MIAAAGQAIMHAAVAALVIEALLRLWRVEDPGERLAMRGIVLAAPILLTTLYLAAAPWRAESWFVEDWSLFAGAHWNHVRLGGIGLASAASAALSAAGAALFLRDALPFVADRLSRTAPGDGLPLDHPACARVRDAIDAAEARGLDRPSVVTVVALDSPVLMCAGIGRTAIVVSTGTLDHLDDAALEAGLAHEMAHLAARDPLTGWWLMAARALQFFNPVVQIVARQAIQDLERRADIAVAARGRARGLADAVHRLSLAEDVHSDLTLPADGRHPAERLLASAHRRAVDARCQLLLERARPARQPWRAWRLGLAASALAVLLFLVV
ncbi:MAG: M56 family metallopeptidase [Vicinamibacterales bacterium]